MKTPKSTPCLPLALVTILLGSALVMVSLKSEARWYTDAQVQQGEKLFADNCASCHGNKAQGLAEDWRKTGPDGKYPPPPLNGTAHAWHHPRKVLRRTIRQGGIKIGGSMPPFAEQLKAEEIDAIIAWFQTHWPDKIYNIWMERDQAATGNQRGAKEFVPLTEEAKAATSSAQADVKEALKASLRPATPQSRQDGTPTKDYLQTLSVLKRRIPGAKLGVPAPSPVPGVLSIEIQGEPIYVTEDGKHAFFGDLVDLTTGDNLTESKRRAKRLALIDTFPESSRVIYPATTQERARLVVFTDTSCPFCRKFHAEINVLLAAGVSVHYIPFPRGGKRGSGYRSLRAVWCAGDPLLAMTKAKQEEATTSANAECARASAVDAGYALGQSVRIRGTPAIVLPSGELINGYRPARELLTLIFRGG